MLRLPAEDTELLAAAAVDMARDARWLDLEQHREHCTPLAAARPGAPAPRTYCCGECQNGGPGAHEGLDDQDDD